MAAGKRSCSALVSSWSVPVGLDRRLLLYLAAAGVGTLGVVDDDVVDESNLHRQVSMTALGRRRKVDSASARLKASGALARADPASRPPARANAAALSRRLRSCGRRQ